MKQILNHAYIAYLYMPPPPPPIIQGAYMYYVHVI